MRVYSLPGFIPKVKTSLFRSVPYNCKKAVKSMPQLRIFSAAVFSSVIIGKAVRFSINSVFAT